MLITQQIVDAVLLGEGPPIEAGLLYVPGRSARDMAMVGVNLSAVELQHRGYVRVPARYAPPEQRLASDLFRAPADGPAWKITHIAVFLKGGDRDLLAVYQHEKTIEPGEAFGLLPLPPAGEPEPEPQLLS